MGVVALDEVGVVAVHRADKGTDRAGDDGVNLARERTRPGDEVKGCVLDLALTIGRQHGLHPRGVGESTSRNPGMNCRFHCRINYSIIVTLSNYNHTTLPVA